MTDIALIWDDENSCADLLVEGGGLATDEGLRTAILISLFTDARAADDDELPEAGADRRGWWGNAFPTGDHEQAEELGSKLWLLERAKATAEAVREAEEWARAALQWIVKDRIAAAVDVQVERQEAGAVTRLALAVILDRPSGPARSRYDFVWEVSL